MRPISGKCTSIVSITPEIALDEFPVLAGGLGILEGDKFYSASQAGVDYTVLTLLYKRGYAELEQVPGSVAVRTGDLFRSLRGRVLVPEKDLKVGIGSFGEATVRPMSLNKGSAKAVFLDTISPQNMVNAAQRLYGSDSYEDEMLKSAILAKAASAYITERIGAEQVNRIDLQESLASLSVLALPKDLVKKTRLVMHTPGPWGHPNFSGDFLWKAFGYSAGREWISLTEIALGSVPQAFTVSKKHHEIMTSCFGAYKEKIGYVTNGVDLERWTHPEIAELLADKGPSNIKVQEILSAHKAAKDELISMLVRYKPGLDTSGDPMVVSWSRRPVEYKRPDFVIRLIEETGKDMDAVFVLSGKAHAKDGRSIDYISRFKSLGEKYRNVVFLPDYDIAKSKAITSGSDLLLFTPFSGQEACGTSYMKAGINGVPTLSSRDGGALEMIEHGKNGWFFGTELHEFMGVGWDPRAREINEGDYKSMKDTFEGIARLRRENLPRYAEVMLNAISSFREKADISVALEKYGIIDKKPTGILPELRGNEKIRIEKVHS